MYMFTAPRVTSSRREYPEQMGRLESLRLRLTLFARNGAAPVFPRAAYVYLMYPPDLLAQQKKTPATPTYLL